jgi:hypothetical protein
MLCTEVPAHQKIAGLLLRSERLSSRGADARALCRMIVPVWPKKSPPVASSGQRAEAAAGQPETSNF